MKVWTKLSAICVLAAALVACSQPVDIVVSQASFGPITVATPFDPDAIAKLLPTRKVESAISSELQPGERVIRVSDGATPLFEAYPSRDGATVQSVLVLDQSIHDDKGVHVGSGLLEAIPDGDISPCNPGRGEKSGRIFCAQPGSMHIIYELQGAAPAPDGMLPDSAVFASWTVTAMLWDGGEPAP